jgi:hypothetical protein
MKTMRGGKMKIPFPLLMARAGSQGSNQAAHDAANYPPMERQEICGNRLRTMIQYALKMKCVLWIRLKEVPFPLAANRCVPRRLLLAHPPGSVEHRFGNQKWLT